jgi:hypothetical protein
MLTTFSGTIGGQLRQVLLYYLENCAHLGHYAGRQAGRHGRRPGSGPDRPRPKADRPRQGRESQDKQGTFCTVILRTPLKIKNHQYINMFRLDALSHLQAVCRRCIKKHDKNIILLSEYTAV